MPHLYDCLLHILGLGQWRFLCHYWTKDQDGFATSMRRILEGVAHCARRQLQVHLQQASSCLYQQYPSCLQHVPLSYWNQEAVSALYFLLLARGSSERQWWYICVVMERGKGATCLALDRANLCKEMEWPRQQQVIVSVAAM